MEDSDDFQKLKTCSSFLNLNHQTIPTLSHPGEIRRHAKCLHMERKDVELCTRWVVPELANCSPITREI